MAKIKGLSQDPRSGIYYLRRKIPEALRPSFACGDFYKVSLGTGDLREAEKRFAVANGEYERKLATFREALTKSGEGRLTLEQAAALVNRHLTSRSPSGFASGGMQVTFILMELDKAVADLAGAYVPTAQSMSAEDWAGYRKRMGAATPTTSSRRRLWRGSKRSMKRVTRRLVTPGSHFRSGYPDGAGARC